MKDKVIGLLLILLFIPVFSFAEVSSNLTETRMETEDGFVLVYTLDGIPVVAEDKGYCSVQSTVDNGLVIEERFFDEKGLPTTANGYYMKRNTYENGKLIRTEYRDEEGQLTKRDGEYAVLEKTEDGPDGAILERYYDENGQPAKRTAGYYGIRHEEIDENGRVGKQTFLDSEGNAFLISGLYSTTVRTYDENGLVLTVMYYTPDGENALMSLGQSGYRYIRDDNGKQIGLMCLDRAGQPMINRQGYGMALYEYDDQGHRVKETYCDIEGRPVALNRGQYGQVFEYRQNQMVRNYYIDANGNEIFLLDQFLAENGIMVYIAALFMLSLCVLLPRHIRWGLLIIYIGFILYMTIFTRVAQEKSANFDLFWSYRQFFTDPQMKSYVINNILLFIPLGALLFSIRPKWIWIAPVLSLLIEAIQYFTGLGLCELDDLFGNTVGSVVGFLLMAGINKIKKGMVSRKADSKQKADLTEACTRV